MGVIAQEGLLAYSSPERINGGRADLQRHHHQLLLQVGANRWEYDHAKLEGAFRRLAVPESSQYDEEAYSEALTDCLEAIKRFIMHTR